MRLVAAVVLGVALSPPARAHCPPPAEPVAGNFRVWIRVVNVGDVMFWAYGPHLLHSAITRDDGWFVAAEAVRLATTSNWTVAL